METSSISRSKRKELGRKPFSDLTNAAAPPPTTFRSAGRKPAAKPRAEVSLVRSLVNAKGKAPISGGESGASAKLSWQGVTTRKDDEEESGIGSQSSCPSGNLSPQISSGGKDKGKEVAAPTKSSDPSRSLFDPRSVPTRKDKGREVSIGSRYSCPRVGRTIRNREISEMEEESNGLRVCSAPNLRHKRRRCGVAESKEEEVKLKDYIEKQRAYFAEIDAFELEVSDASSD